MGPKPYRGPFADELGCQTLLEGNSNAGEEVPGCGLDLRIELRAGRGCAVRARLAGDDRGRVRALELRVRGGEPVRDPSAPFGARVVAPRGRSAVAAVAVTADGSRIPLASRPVRC